MDSATPAFATPPPHAESALDRPRLGRTPSPASRGGPWRVFPGSRARREWLQVLDEVPLAPAALRAHLQVDRALRREPAARPRAQARLRRRLRPPRVGARARPVPPRRFVGAVGVRLRAISSVSVMRSKGARRRLTMHSLHRPSSPPLADSGRAGGGRIGLGPGDAATRPAPRPSSAPLFSPPANAPGGGAASGRVGGLLPLRLARGPASAAGLGRGRPLHTPLAQPAGACAAHYPDPCDSPLRHTSQGKGVGKLCLGWKDEGDGRVRVGFPSSCPAARRTCVAPQHDARARSLRGDTAFGA